MHPIKSSNPRWSFKSTIKKRIKNIIIIISLIVIFILGTGVSRLFLKTRKSLTCKQLLLSSQLEITEQNLKLSELKLDGFKRTAGKKTVYRVYEAAAYFSQQRE